MRKKSWLMWVSMAVFAFAAVAGGCGGGGGGDGGGGLPGGGSLAVSPSGLSLKVGESGVLTAVNYTGGLTWTSAQPLVATATPTGAATAIVTAVSAGTTTILVNDARGQFARCPVIVTANDGSTPEPEEPEEPEPESAEAPVNPEFAEWQERIDRGEIEEPLYGLIPDPIDWSHLGKVDYRQFSEMRAMAVLPPSYDARTVGVVTGVKNQFTYGTCWAHGALASLESTVLKTGTLSDPDLSERHLAWFAYRDDGTYPAFTNVYGDDYRSGNLFMAGAILTRWTGPVNEADCPYNQDMGALGPASGYTRVLAVTDVYNLFIAPLAEETGNELKDRQSTYEAIQELLMSEGAIGVSYNHVLSPYSYYNEVNAAYYFPPGVAVPPNTGHTVAIVGWDNNYPSANFNVTPPGNGTWLIKNSWGSSWGDNGYMWISYYDATLDDVVLFKGENTGRYRTMYLYDPLGMTDRGSGWSDKSSMWAANVFSASESGRIDAVAFNTSYPLIDYEVRIYKNLTDASKPSSGALQMGSATTGRLTYVGYHTVRLKEPATLAAGESFSVVIKISKEDSGIFFPVENRVSNRSDAATATAGQSFLTSVSEPDVSAKWWDLYYAYDPTANFCIRALANPVSSVAPTIDTASLPGGTVGTAYSQTLVASGTAPINWTIESGVLPLGLGLNAASGEISGTPTTAGTSTFTVRATNAAGSATKALSIEIASITTAPEITTDSLPGGLVGTPYNQILNATGTEPITWSVTSGDLPSGLNLNIVSGEISGTPTRAGTPNFTVQATNSAGNAQKNLSIAITAAPVAPTITTTSLPNGRVGTAYSQTLAASGTAPITWAIASGALPSGLSLNTATGEISGTPTTANTYSFTVRATNAAGNATKALGITVAASTVGNWIDVADTRWYDNAPNSASYTIETAEQLAGLAKVVNTYQDFFDTKTVTLAANIDLAGRQWTPIGRFNGVFNGGNHTISNLTFLGEPVEGCAGLFGVAWAMSTIQNVNLTNVNINASSSLSNATFDVGGIVGANNGTVSNCTSSGSVSSSSPSHSNVGGIAGYINGTVSNCTSSGSVSSSSIASASNAGGIVGANGGTVSDCTSNANVSSYCSSHPALSPLSVSAGGIVGTNAGTSSSNTTLSNCASTGNVYCSSSAGGIAGINNPYCKVLGNRKTDSGRVSSGGIGSNAGAGGIVGWNLFDTIVSGNEFSRTATGQQRGIGRDDRYNGQPSDDGAEPTD